MGPLKILLVDDHEVVRIGLAGLLSRNPNFQIVGEAVTAREAVDKAAQLSPDVVIMDIRLMDGDSGVEACREICNRDPNSKVIMLTSYADEEAVFASIMAGAKGYVLKQIGSQALIEVVERVGRGESLLDPAVTATVLDRMRRIAQGESEDSLLTPQEKRILALVAEGKTNKEIAQQVYLSEKTVRNYVSSILNKLNFQNRTEAAAYVLRKRTFQ